MLGCHEGHVTSQSEVLTDLLRRDGLSVVACSTQIRPIPRLIDSLVTTTLRRREYDLAILDVFSGRGFLSAEVLSWWIRTVVRRPIVLTLRGGALPQLAQSSRSRVHKLLDRAAAVVAPSDYQARAMSSMSPGCTVIPNVINLADYPFKQHRGGQPRILWMRAFHSVYGPDIAVRTLELLQQRHPEARLTMGGQDSGLLETTRSLVRNLGLEDSVHFAGYLANEKKLEAFAQHNVYLNTNRIDNMPVTLLEAAATGLPIVATNVGGIPDLLTHEVDALLTPTEPTALADAICRLLEEPDLAETLTKAARRLAEGTDWSVVRTSWANLFERVLTMDNNTQT